jgi:hypothetical protein
VDTIKFLLDGKQCAFMALDAASKDCGSCREVEPASYASSIDCTASDDLDLTTAAADE